MAGFRLLLAALALPGATAMVAAAPPCPAAQEVSAGIYLLPGADAEPSPSNGGKVANRVFIVGPTGVTVIDPGPGAASANEIGCAVARVSPQPVVAVINTHPHPENVLGNTAYPRLPVFAHANAAEAMAERCTDCRRRLLERIGEAGALAEQASPTPNRPVSSRLEISPGGRRLVLIPLGSAHSPGDLAALDAETGALVAGDLLNTDRLPDLHDGSVSAALAALRLLQSEPGIRLLVPGRGPPAQAERLSTAVRYLETLWAYAQQRVDSPDGFVPPDTIPEILTAYSSRATDSAQQLLNLQHALREAEADWWQTEKR